MAKTWLITGCSSGFGKRLATAVAARGDNVLATARTSDGVQDLVSKYPDTVKATALEVTKEGSTAAVVKLAEETFGGLDVLVNNAGFGFMDAIEEATAEEYYPLFETNVFGLFETSVFSLIETTRAALPVLRKRQRARVVNFSPGAGIVGTVDYGYYNATKMAVERLSESLAREFQPLGLKVIIVEPSPFRTEFLGRSIKTAKHEIGAYAGTSGKLRLYRDNNSKQTGTPGKAAAVILKAVDADDPPLHLPLGPVAYSMSERKLGSFSKDIEAWRDVAIPTDFD